MEANISFQSNRGTVYPGEYIPLRNAEEMTEDLKRSNERHIQPFVNLCEQTDHYKIEVTVPGFKREDFFVSINNNMLAIAVMHKPFPGTEEGRFQLHEFNYEPFEHTIILPEDADAEFVRAEYLAGILTIHLSKTSYPARQTNTVIIVY